MWEWWRKNRVVLLGLLLLLAALLWYSVSLRQQKETSFFETLLMEATGPVQSAFTSLVRSTADIWGSYINLVDTEQQNRRLREQNSLLKSELNQLKEISLENQRLRRLLEFKKTQPVKTLPARVIAEDATSWFRTVVIDKGYADQVHEGQPVVAAEGVVGRVIRNGPHESRVLLITDAASAVAALVQDSRSRGICRGQGRALSFDFVLRKEPLELGEAVITSGMGGVFPKGLLIGHVSSVNRMEFGLFQAVEIMPAVDFSRLEEVLVLLREVEP
ncbi:MAG TPA: rod shape-determining protein MreC [Desulfuromonadales bacterium]|nr:rod shape-determining protein MreC [Desulfuromonadales bacterium]